MKSNSNLYVDSLLSKLASRSKLIQMPGNFHFNASIADIVHEAFDALNEAAITYSLLRGYDELAQTGKRIEIDLLVSPTYLLRLAEVLTAKNFIQIPAWGYAPHHFFVAYDKRNELWLKFDVVTTLRYGKPIRALCIDMTERCLRNRRWRSPTYVLSPEDEFATLLLHCLLDKTGFRDAHRARLIDLHNRISSEPEAGEQLAQHFEQVFAPAITWRMLTYALDTPDWASLMNKRSALAWQLFGRKPALAVWYSLSGWLVRRMRLLLFALSRRGILVALIAPDGAGKSSLAERLALDPQLRARTIYMGNNAKAKAISLPWTEWLQKRRESRDNAPRQTRISPTVIKGLQFSNRLVEQWYRLGIATLNKLCGRFVVFDRYVYDCWLASRGATGWERLRRRLLEAGWPKPDLVILLDAPGDVLYQRKGEHTAEWLERQRLAYHSITGRIPQAVIIDTTHGADEVRREVTSLIWDHYRTRAYKIRAGTVPAQS